MGDDDRGPAQEQALQSLLDPPLGPHVDVRRRLVEDQDPGLGQKGAGEGDDLALAGGKRCAALADLGVDAVLEARDQRLAADRVERPRDVLVTGVGTPEGDVLGRSCR